eukprot:UN4807
MDPGQSSHCNRKCLQRPVPWPPPRARRHKTSLQSWDANETQYSRCSCLYMPAAVKLSSNPPAEEAVVASSHLRIAHLRVHDRACLLGVISVGSPFQDLPSARLPLQNQRYPALVVGVCHEQRIVVEHLQLTGGHRDHEALVRLV